MLVRRLLVIVPLLLFAAAFTRAALDDVYFVGPPSHNFDGGRFFNPGGPQPTGLAGFLRWQLTADRADWPASVPVRAVRPPARVAGADLRVTMVGHATLLIQTRGLNILTDPVWSDRVGPFGWAGPKRVTAPGIAFADLPRIDAVIVSHNHYDHMDVATLRRLWQRDRPLIIVPLGNAALLARAGVTAIAGDWNARIALSDAVSVRVARVQHWSSRWGADRNRALWAGYAIDTPEGAVFFAGDCGYDASAFRDAARTPGDVRLALLPIGAYAPRWFMRYQHMNPAEAVLAMRDLGARHAVGMHWGTWQLTDEAREAPLRELAAARSAAGIAPARFPALAPGEALLLPGR